MRDTQSLISRAVQLHQLGRLDEAAVLYKAALKEQPKLFDALHLLGVIRGQQGRLDEARDLLRQALKQKPADIGALSNYGLVLIKLHRGEEAVACYDKLIARKPDYAEGHNNRGNALDDLQRHDEALASYDRAIAINPNYAEAHYNRGSALFELGRTEAAVASYDTALAINPTYAKALNNRGTAQLALNRPADALASCEHALAIAPDYAEALSNKAIALQLLGRNAEAVECWRRALVFKPDFLAARWQLAIGHLPFVPDSEDARIAGRAAFADALADLAPHITRDPQAHEMIGEVQPFYLAYHDEPNRELLTQYGALCVEAMQHWQTRHPIRPAGTRAGPRCRIGIVSAFVCDHPVWNALIKGWVEHLDRDRFELHLFDLGTTDDKETQWARAHATSFTKGPMRLQQWVETIAGRKLDALLYSEIGMDLTTVKLASLRLARVQLATWGHPETTGLPTIDAFVSADALEPADAQANYCERLIRLPQLGCCYRPLAVETGEIDLAALGIDASRPILLCPGTPFKYAPRGDRVLAEIAQRLGRGQLVFFMPDNCPPLAVRLRERLTRSFQSHGLSLADHAVFIPWQGRPAYYQLMARSDLLLDTFAFSGFNTAMQAVECGLPVVAMEGAFLRGRLASGPMRTMQLDELVATDEQQYVELAVGLATNREARNALARRMEGARGVLFDDTGAVRALEHALIEACRT